MAQPHSNRYMKYYSSTSEAYDLNYLDSRRAVVRKEWRKNIYAKPKIKYIGINKTLFSGRAVFSIILIFICVMGLSLAFAFTTFKRSHITGLRAQLLRQEEQNAILATEISLKYDMDQIKEIAVERLGMIEPRPHQIVYIPVPRQNYSLYNEGAEVNENEEIYSALKDFNNLINRFLHRVTRFLFN